MSDKTFGQMYADHYDQLYGDKDYEKECDLIEHAFRRHAQIPVRAILDLGCGTGSHAIPLTRRGFRVTGVDRSMEMLDCARNKVANGMLPAGSQGPELIHGDVRTVNLDRRFDAVLMMFAVLGYQLTNEDVMAALRTVRKHLKPGGLFVCDVWYGPAVLTTGPSERVKIIPTADGQIIRAASGSLDTYHHLCEVRYHLWSIIGNQMVSEIQESHQMRYFFAQELCFYMQQAKLELNEMCGFEEFDRQPGETTWNVLVTAKRHEKEES